jgi:hypothetical protein
MYEKPEYLCMNAKGCVHCALCRGDRKEKRGGVEDRSFLYVHFKGRFGFLCKHEKLNTLQRHCCENLKQIFPEMKLCGLVPNSYIHVSVRDIHVFPGSVCLFCFGLICKHSKLDTL